jgi:hypothetical protein
MSDEDDADDVESEKGAGTTRARADAGASMSSSRAMLVGVVALAAGAAVGWFGHQAQAKARLRAEAAPAASGSGVPAGPCSAWQQKLCASGGEQSAACQQAKAATSLLTAPACEAALDSLPATLEKVKAARVPCDTLVSKLCKDLPPNSSTCQMVKERTPSFPSERCVGMLTNYDKVIAELKMMDQQSGMQLGGPGGMPPGMPHGMPPGMSPGMSHGSPPGMPPGAPGSPHP